MKIEVTIHKNQFSSYYEEKYIMDTKNKPKIIKSMKGGKKVGKKVI